MPGKNGKSGGTERDGTGQSPALVARDATIAAMIAAVELDQSLAAAGQDEALDPFSDHGKGRKKAVHFAPDERVAHAAANEGPDIMDMMKDMLREQEAAAAKAEAEAKAPDQARLKGILKKGGHSTPADSGVESGKSDRHSPTLTPGATPLQPGGSSGEKRPWR